MITEVRFENFRCLRDVVLHLGRLTAMVGANASGKTSILEGLRADLQFKPVDAWWRQEKIPCSRSFTFDDGRMLKQDFRRNPRTGQVMAPLSFRSQVLRLELAQLRLAKPIKQVSYLDENGANLNNLFATLSRYQQIAVVEALREIVPVFADVNLRPGANSSLELFFQDRWADPVVEYTTAEVSDGSMLMFAFLVLQYQDPAPDLIAIEEPERSLHPFLMGQVVSCLRNLSQGKLGPRPVQVVLATHSAEMLEFLQPEEVRFLTRDEIDGSVKVEEAPTGPAWEEAYQEYKKRLGGIWLSGGLGGVPGALA